MGHERGRLFVYVRFVRGRTTSYLCVLTYLCLRVCLRVLRATLLSCVKCGRKQSSPVRRGDTPSRPLCCDRQAQPAGQCSRCSAGLAAPAAAAGTCNEHERQRRENERVAKSG